MNYSIRRLINILVIVSSFSLLLLGVSAIISNFMMNKNQEVLINAMRIKSLSSSISNLIVSDLVRQENYFNGERQGIKIGVSAAFKSNAPFYAFREELIGLSEGLPKLQKTAEVLDEQYDHFMGFENAIIKNLNDTISLRLKLKERIKSMDLNASVLREKLNISSEKGLKLQKLSENLKENFLSFLTLTYRLRIETNLKLFDVNFFTDITKKVNSDIKEILALLKSSDPLYKDIFDISAVFTTFFNQALYDTNSVYELRSSLNKNEHALLENRKLLFESVKNINAQLSQLKLVVTEMSEIIIPASKRLSSIILLTVSTLALIFLTMFIFLGRNILKVITSSLNKLVDAMINISSGNSSLDQRVDVPPQIELANLSNSFNDMIAQLDQSQLNMQKLNNAYQKFVPEKGLELLGRKSITEICLGDYVECSMSVLFSDIRDFTSITENMTASESFAFINEYLQVMEPIIEKNNGFIDKYIGDAVMALFPDKNGADDAVRAAIDMMDALKGLNISREARGLIPIGIGVGVNTGELILGTIGGNIRMEETVIGDTVNVASRMESLNKQFGTQILISEPTFRSLSSNLDLKIRNIGFTAIKGKAKKAAAYEVYSHCHSELIEQKEKVSVQLLEGCDLIEENKYKEAEIIFKASQSLAPLDPLLNYYIKLLMERSRRAGD